MYLYKVTIKSNYKSTIKSSHRNDILSKTGPRTTAILQTYDVDKI